MKFKDYLNEYNPSKMMKIRDIISHVQKHNGTIVAFATGWGMYPGSGEMEIDKKRLIKKLKNLDDDNAFLEFYNKNNVMYVGFALTYLNKKNFNKIFPR